MFTPSIPTPTRPHPPLHNTKNTRARKQAPGRPSRARVGCTAPGDAGGTALRGRGRPAGAQAQGGGGGRGGGAGGEDDHAPSSLVRGPPEGAGGHG